MMMMTMKNTHTHAFYIYLKGVLFNFQYQSKAADQERLKSSIIAKEVGKNIQNFRI